MEIHGWVMRIVRQCSRRAGFFDVTFSSDAPAAINVPFIEKFSLNNRRSSHVAATTVSKNIGPRYEPSAAR
jgi:hypothetical protein